MPQTAHSGHRIAHVRTTINVIGSGPVSHIPRLFCPQQMAVVSGGRAGQAA
jgi:hypothetical protein